jgi:hypothetical protein
MKRAGAAFLLLATACLAACAGLGQAVTNTMVDLEAALCVLQTYSTEVQGAIPPAQAAVDAFSKCNVAADVGQQILTAHLAAAEREARPISVGDAGGQ